ncbi:MAG TPA: helix-turn-helix domain-containing protein, partial [Burkholderiaceae bacterium]|nr:helix-turn-helix domain-containing protein [Burkholderiaceae bacterium]
FDTARVDPRERAGFWREVVCSVYVPMNAEPLVRQAFHARMDVRAACGRIYSAVDAGPQQVSRDAVQIARDETRDIYTFMVQRAGTCGVEQAGANALLLPGDMLLFDNSQPYRLRFDQPFRQIVIQAPRACFGAMARDLERRLAQRLPPTGGFGRLVEGFVKSLDEALPDTDDSEAAVLVDELFHLLAAHSAATRTADDGGVAAQRALVERAQRYARERIGDPELSLAVMAGAQRVSPRTLQRAFASRGTGVMRWLRDERLARCAAALADPTLAARAIADIVVANGLRDVPAFCRSFKARYGRTPGDWRTTQGRRR